MVVKLSACRLHNGGKSSKHDPRQSLVTVKATYTVHSMYYYVGIVGIRIYLRSTSQKSLVGPSQQRVGGVTEAAVKVTLHKALL